MSLYNLIFGMNRDADMILALIGLKRHDIQRFRDCWLSDDGGICVYTRTGGGNREDYPNTILTSSPYYIHDEDDEWDHTYANYYFRIPDEIVNDMDGFKDPVNNGVSANLLQWLDKTINREQTESDLKEEVRCSQIHTFNNLIYSGDLTRTWNGHTCVILSDRGAEAVFELYENDDELYYYVCPYKIDVVRDDYEYDFQKKKGGVGKCRVAVTQPKDWIIDKEAANMYLDLFGNKYPKAAKHFREKWAM